MMHPADTLPLIVVDDDPGVLDAIRFLLEVERYRVMAYASGEDLLEEAVLPERACLILDQCLPGISGLHLLCILRKRGHDYPAILITTPSPALLRRARAVNLTVVEKPLVSAHLLDAVQSLH